ncbi:MAG: chemotaxis protein CheC [Candidatus Omnitrophica bacterium]|nr:chemotaxis protein CheC [Candidatus Omnitrophota bacterium]
MNSILPAGQGLTPEQIDVLKEIGNICVGNSTGILSQLLGGTVDVYLPGLDILDEQQLYNYIKSQGKLVYGVNAQISSQLQGTIFLLFPERHALRIIEKFLSELHATGSQQTQFGISIIKEIGGIALFSYLNTLSSLIKKLILSSVPNFLSGTVDELMGMMLRDYEHWGRVCVVHTSFLEQSMGIEGSYYLILSRNSAETILQAVS